MGKRLGHFPWAILPHPPQECGGSLSPRLLSLKLPIAFDLRLGWFWISIDWRIRGRQCRSFCVLALGLSLGSLSYDLLQRADVVGEGLAEAFL